ncbi:MAG: leucine-rich repeat domain-containing protein [Halanaerobiaceae bacterium]|nr:leucine-rich repeat domain-containing protein [Halanaerobiaceae bacterium]
MLKVTEHMTITAYFEKAIHFNDINLEAALRDILKIPEGYIFPSDFTEITELDLSKRNITDISALAYADFSNLVSLNLASNNISDISVLADMRLLDLETLDLSFNKISDIS